MKIAITGAMGFMGRHLLPALASEKHSLVLISRSSHRGDLAVRAMPIARFSPIGISDRPALQDAFEGCDAVVHLAGINLERGAQTYERVHVDGTRLVVEAARRAGVRKLVITSFLRARPACGSPYHESKFAAEEIVRGSGLDYTVLKPGVVYGRGDHMLDHLGRGLRTFPVFPLVGFEDHPVRPLAVADLIRVLVAAATGARLSGKTVALTGPEELTLAEVVRRVGRVVGSRAIVARAPVGFHLLLAWLCERTMTVPLASLAQVRILSESLDKPLPPCEYPPPDLLPKTPFTDDQIREGLPAGSFGPQDCLCISERLRRWSSLAG